MQLLQFIGPLITVALAIVGLHAWHRQLIAKRRFEVAEQVLSAFFGAEAALRFIRSPFAGSNEGRTRERAEHESGSLAELRDSLFVPIERVNSAQAAFVEAEKAAIIAEIHFGKQVRDDIRQLLAARSQVVHSAGMLMRLQGQAGLPSDAAIKRQTKHEAVIWSLGTKAGDADVDPEQVDVLTAEIEAAKVRLEAACRPYLRAPTFWDFLFGRRNG